MIHDKVEKLLADYRPEHSEFQMQNFIVGTSGHPWGRYKQSLRELSARGPAVEALRAEIRAAEAEVDSLKARAWFPIGRKKRALKTALMESRIETKKNDYKSKMREYAVFYRIARDLKREIGEIDPEKRRRLEAEAWVDKARRLAALDIWATNGIQRQTAEFIISMPREYRRAIFAELNPENRKNLLSVLV